MGVKQCVVASKVTPETFEAIEAARGDQKRSAWINDVIEAALPNAGTPGLPVGSDGDGDRVVGPPESPSDGLA